MRKGLLVAMVAVATAVLVLMLLPIRELGHFGQRHYVFTTRFEDVAGLRSGARVSLAGVELGSVRSVKPRPEFRDQPIEVVMDVWTDKDVRIPSDAVLTIETAGILGESFVNIVIRDAIGGPADEHAFLKSVSTPQFDWKEALEKFGAGLRRCDTELSKIESSPKSSQENKPKASRRR